MVFNDFTLYNQAHFCHQNHSENIDKKAENVVVNTTLMLSNF